MISPKKLAVTFSNDFYTAFSTSPNWSSDFTSWVNYLICGPTNTSSLILASLLLGDLFFKYMNAALLWSLPWRNFLWVQVWCGVEVNKLFSIDEWSIYTFLSWNKWFSFRPLFLDVMMFSVPTIAPCWNTRGKSVLEIVKSEYFLLQRVEISLYLGEERYLGIHFNSTVGTFILALGIAFIFLSWRSVFAVSTRQPLPYLVQRRGVQNEDIRITVFSILATFTLTVLL